LFKNGAILIKQGFFNLYLFLSILYFFLFFYNEDYSVKFYFMVLYLSSIFFFILFYNGSDDKQYIQFIFIGNIPYFLKFAFLLVSY